MQRMKLNDFRPLFDKITDGKILIGIHNDHMIFAFYRNLTDGKVYAYNNILSSSYVDEEGTKFMETEWDIPTEEVRTDFVNYDMFLAWNRRNIIRFFEDYPGESEDKSNYRLISEELKNDGGKIVKFKNMSYNVMGLLIGATSTDEDYYYLYVDANYKIHSMTCVGGYTVLEDKEIPRNLRKFKDLSREDSKHIRNLLEIRLLRTAEVFLTPIYLKHFSEADLTLFNQYSLLYLKEN